MGMRMQQPDQFELARQRASQQANAAKQTQADAIKRRFASQGMAGSGAAMKQEQLANEAVDKQLGDTNQGIDAAAQQEAARKQEIADQRDFAQKERMQSQEFAKAEREGSQAYASGESAAARKLQQDLFEKDLGFKQSSLTESSRQFNQQFDLGKAQFAQDREITGLNAIIAASQAGIPWTGFKFDAPFDTSAIDQKINDLATQKFSSIEAQKMSENKATQDRAKTSVYGSNRSGGR